MRYLAAAALAALLLSARVDDREVVLDTETLVYHCRPCELVKNCGAACVVVDLSEAKRRGAKPCRVCGGDNCPAHSHATVLRKPERRLAIAR